MFGRGSGTCLAARIAPKGRRPTAEEIWLQRALRAEDGLDDAQLRRGRDLLRDYARTLRPEREDWRKGGQPNPLYGDPARQERRRQELRVEIGELLGIGPPPRVKP